MLVIAAISCGSTIPFFIIRISKYFIKIFTIGTDIGSWTQCAIPSIFLYLCLPFDGEQALGKCTAIVWSYVLNSYGLSIVYEYHFVWSWCFFLYTHLLQFKSTQKSADCSLLWHLRWGIDRSSYETSIVGVPWNIYMFIRSGNFENRWTTLPSSEIAETEPTVLQRTWDGKRRGSHCHCWNYA